MNTSTGASTWGLPTCPSARASASTTSARPPVFAHGSHSAAMNATRIATAGVWPGPARAVGPLDLHRRRRNLMPIGKSSDGPRRHDPGLFTDEHRFAALGIETGRRRTGSDPTPGPDRTPAAVQDL